MTAYHLLGREGARRIAWWRPLVEFVVVLVLFFGIFAAMIALFDAADQAFNPAVKAMGDFEFVDTPWLALAAGSIPAANIPAAFLAARIRGRRPAALWSTEHHFRWRIFGLALMPALVFFGAELAFSVARAPENATAASDGGFTLARFGALCILIALIPLQALSEELVFRGSLVQVVGQWTRSPWVAYLVPALLFVSVHNYDWRGQLSVLTFALCGAFLTWSTGGLEASLAVHAVANTLSFVTDPFHVYVAGLAEATVVDVVASINATVLATAAIWWLVTRAGGIASKSCQASLTPA